MRVVLVDGIPSADGTLRLDADDPGLTLGMSVFETLRTYEGRPFRLDAHLRRLEASAAALGVPWPGETLLRTEIALALARAEGELNLRVTLTAGGARVVRAERLQTPSGGAVVATRVWEPPPWLPGSIKHTSRAGSSMVLREAGTDEVLWMDASGALLEGTRSNVMAVASGALWTPPTDGRILAGVTREAVLEAAMAIGVELRIAPVLRDNAWDELYLCSTLRELQPIVTLDGAPAPGGGPVGEAVLAAFNRSRAESA